jgi:transcriptional regulator with GAF, ATPase, and Fis domain
LIDERGSDEELLERVGAIGRELSEADGLQATLQLIVDLADDLLQHSDGGSLMLIGRGRVIDSPAYSSSVAYESDMAQLATGQGPCLDAIGQEHTTVIEDFETERRWPDYRARTLELGMRSMISFRLFVTDDSMGALNLYSRRPNGFDRRSQILGQVYAAQASVAMKAALIEAGLNTAIRSRDVIGQAKGILMARHRLTADMAFEVLRRLSQDRNQKLATLAEEIAETGAVPAPNR